MKRAIKVSIILFVFFIIFVGGLTFFSINSIEEKKENSDILNTLICDLYIENLLTDSNIITVGTDKKYKTIQQAVDSASDGDYIIVFPGTYNEAVSASEKSIKIIGTDKNECILTYPNGDYYNPPLEMGSGVLANMTLYATSQEIQDDAIAKAYTLHIDYDISSNNSFHAINVDFINDDCQVAGIGLRSYFTLKFTNCVFRCNKDNNALFIHDDATNIGAVFQKVIFKNCVFENSGEKSTLLFRSQEMINSNIIFEWVNNTVINHKSTNTFYVWMYQNEDSTNEGWLGTSFWELSENSKNNNIDILNY